MKILVNKNSSLSLQRQIESEIENRIKTGVLKPDTRLPSVRDISKQSGVSLMTVVKAYNNLAINGYIEKIQGKGSYVRWSLDELNEKELEKQTAELSNDGRQNSFAWQDYVQDYISRGSFRHNANLSLDYKGANLSVAAIGAHLLPTEKIFNRALKEGVFSFEKAGTYPPVEGDYAMRASVQSYLLNRNVDVSIEDILITSGSQLAISLIAMTYIGQGDVVVVGAPTYPGAIDVFKNRGAHVVEVPVDENGMDMYALLSICETYKIKFVYVMPNFQNPTGVLMNLEKRQMLLELASEHNFLIIEDDSWSEVSFVGPTIPLKSMDKAQRVIYISGFSKLYSPAYRISCIVTHGSLYTRLVSSKSNLDMGAPILIQHFLSGYLNSLEQKSYLVELNHELKQLRDRTYALLIEKFPAYVKVNKPKGGLVFWLTFPMDFNCRLFYYRSVMDHNISFLIGEYCYAEKRGSNQLRLCYTFTDEATLRKSIHQLGAIVDEIYKDSRRLSQRPLL